MIKGSFGILKNHGDAEENLAVQEESPRLKIGLPRKYSKKNSAFLL